MNYYILPKNYHIFNFLPQIQEDELQIYTTYSLLKCYNKFMEQPDITPSFFKLANPYEYIFSTIPEINTVISKLTATNCIFYDLHEIFTFLNFFDGFTTSINSFYISEKLPDLIYCHNLFREDKNDTIISSKNIDDNITDVKVSSFDFIFYELINDTNVINGNINQYTIQLLQFLRIILLTQKNNGNCIIKIDHLFYKPIIDIIYIFCSLYEKVSIFKPTTNNITNFEKYIICSKFILNKEKKADYNDYIIKIDAFLITNNNNKSKNISTILSSSIPCYFLNKIDDINIIFGQQQLETIDQLINIFKNKNKDDKLELLKKANIQKSINWCEKYKIPHNKIIDKPNIFLPLKKNNEKIMDEEVETLNN
jgi:hypothetical protein